MKRLKTINFYVFLTILFLLQTSASQASELWININRCDPLVDPSCTPPGRDDINTLAGNAIDIALGLVATISLLFLIYGGITYTTSAGNPDSVGKAKSTILYSIIGLVLAILSYAIINFVIKIFP